MRHNYETGVNWLKEKKESLESNLEKIITNKGVLLGVSAVCFGLVALSGDNIIEGYKHSVPEQIATGVICGTLSTALILLNASVYRGVLKEEELKPIEYKNKDFDYEFRNSEFD